MTNKDSLLLLFVNTLPVHCVTISTGMEQKTPLIQTGISHTQDMIMHHRLILSPECAFKTSCGSDYKNQHMNMILYLISRTEFNRNHPKFDWEVAHMSGSLSGFSSFFLQNITKFNETPERSEVLHDGVKMTISAAIPARLPRRVAVGYTPWTRRVGPLGTSTHTHRTEPHRTTAEFNPPPPCSSDTLS